MYTDYFNSKERVPSVLPRHTLSARQANEQADIVQNNIEHLEFEHIMAHISTAKDSGLKETWIDVTKDGSAMCENNLLKLQQLGYHIIKKPKLWLVKWDDELSGVIEDGN